MRSSAMSVPVAVLVVCVSLLAAGCASSSSGEESDPMTGEESVECQALLDEILSGWETGDAADIEAIYAPDAQLILDGEVLADDRDELVQVVANAVNRGAGGNTYTQVGPCAGYIGTSGDLYISALVEIGGAGHPLGVPAVGFYRLHDGLVTRQVFLDAEHY